jgi:hypothetical protein
MIRKAEFRISDFEVRMPAAANSKSEIRISKFVIFLFILAVALPLLAQQPPTTSPYTPTDPLPLGDVLLSLPTSHIPGTGAWEIRFTHRFNQSIDQGNLSDRVHSLFGLDSNADVGIGVSWALRRDFEVSLTRSNVLDDLELAGKYVVFQQAPALPASLALRAGTDWRTEQNLNDRSSVFVQAIVSRQFGKRVEVFAMPTYVTNAGRAVTGQTSGALFRHAFNVPVGGAVMVTRAMSVVGELIPRNRDLPSATHTDLGWSIGLKTAVGGHYFEVLLTNSNATHADQYVTSTYQGAPLVRGDIHLGFNIERRFGKPRS